MRTRVIIFLVVLVVIALLQQQRVIGGAVPMSIGVVAYAIVLLPMVSRRPVRNKRQEDDDGEGG